MSRIDPLQLYYCAQLDYNDYNVGVKYAAKGRLTRLIRSRQITVVTHRSISIYLRSYRAAFVRWVTFQGIVVRGNLKGVKRYSVCLVLCRLHAG